MQLSRGATGFWASNEEPLPLIDVRHLRGLCFQAARLAHARMGSWHEAGRCSFHTVSITGARTSDWLLLHAHLPLVAFSAVAPRSGQPVAGFTEPPSWAGVFEAGGLGVLGPLTLDLRISAVDLGALSAAERAQVDHWQPQTLGDLLFN
jgi:hypothetical protein